ncbi:MAG: CDP-diacylglycerol--serine O-phosphatidyltransferase [Candidatus Marinimicrobia bacterium]|nr:CDP-diacylglycerol--serine O-phosphatidyltransferase [Candidatus Neomarinimicrobiota bacterium]
MTEKKRYIPNLVTILNLFFGFLAIIKSLHEHYLAAFLFIFVGAILDTLDGKIARFLGRESLFGKEFDSLADLISFCAAPAFMIYKIYLAELGLLGMGISFIFLLFGAIRLAEYNSNTHSGADNDFSGLPVPAAALTVGSFIWFSFTISGGHGNTEAAIALILIASFLMVSNIPFTPFPKITFSKNWFITLRSLFVIILFILFVIFKGYVLFPVMSLYVINNIIKWMVRAKDNQYIHYNER